MEKYDVVIIGAGPAGLNCAKHLQSDKKILILEKNNVIGPKVCAGGLTYKCFKYLDCPDELIERKIEKIKYRSSLFESYYDISKKPIHMVSREKLAKWQMGFLGKNCEIRKGVNVTTIMKDHVVIDDKKIYFKYLVGADGTNSIVRKHLGLRLQDYTIGIQYIIPTKKKYDLELIYDSKYFNAWYGWIFPHDGYISIGCMADPRQISISDLRKQFLNWMKQNHIDYSKGEYQGFPISYDYQGYKFENVFLVGEAAGFGSSYTGEGIYQAMVSGEDVAKIIQNDSYEPKYLPIIFKDMKRHNFYTNLFCNLGILRDFVFNSIGLYFKVRK